MGKVCQGHHDTAPWMWWRNPQQFISSQRGARSPGQGVGGAGFSQGLSPPFVHGHQLS